MPREMTDADRAMLHALAEQVLLDRIQRQQIDLEWVDPRGKGRCRFRRDPEQLELTPAEVMWVKLQAEFLEGRITLADRIAPTQEGSEDDTTFPE